MPLLTSARRLRHAAIRSPHPLLLSAATHASATSSSSRSHPNRNPLPACCIGLFPPPQTWLATTAQPGGGVGDPNGDAGPSPSANGPATTDQAGREPQARGPPAREGRGVSNGNTTRPRASQSRAFSRGRDPRGWGAEARPRTAVFNGVRRGGGKRGAGGQGRGRVGQGRDSGGAAEMEGQGKTLKELVMFDQILSQV